MAPAITRFADCESSVFISYSHADDQVYGNWITDFAGELKRDLAAELSRLKTSRAVLPPVHLSRLNGPTAGDLAPELKSRVARSFAMVIVVGRHYVGSEWCLNELRYFRDTFGDEGLDRRLFIIALGEEPIQQVAELPAWKECFRARNPVWQPFFPDGLESSRPVPVLRPDGNAPTPAFTRLFDRLRTELVNRIKQDLSAPQQPGPHASKLLIGAAVPELAAAIGRFADAARLKEPSVSVLDVAALRRNAGLAERLRDAEFLVLPFNGSQPLYPTPDGGHIATQLEMWRRLGKPDEHVLALDLREVAAADPAEPEHLAYVDALTVSKMRPDDLLARLFPPPPPPPTGQEPPPPPVCKPVKLFIESNQQETSLWKPLGEQVRRRWQKLLEERDIHVPLSFRSTGLNLDEIDLYNLNDADGLILLWGHKEKRSLMSHINLCEDLTNERSPGIVAYLSPPQPHSDRAPPAMGWQVLRFCSALPPDEVTPELADEPELTRFLTEVLDRTSRRHKLNLS